MRTARRAALTAFVLSVTGVVPLMAAAQAATTDLYVDQANTACSDTSATAGSQGTPYCTISAAAAVVNPGQTVHIGRGLYNENVHLTRSGAPGAPITFVGAPTFRDGQPTNVQGPTDGHGFFVDGVHDIGIEHFTVRAGQEAVLVTGSQHITLNHVDSYSNGWSGNTTNAYPSIRVSGQSSDVTVSRSSIYASRGDGIAVDQGVANAVITTNLLDDSAGRGVSVTDAPGTAVTSNTVVDGCGPAIELAGNSSASTVENNALEESDSAVPPFGACVFPSRADLTVSAASATGTKADYNTTVTTAKTPYVWAGQSFADLASFQQAASEGAHDLSVAQANLEAGLADSADANAPGELATDINDAARVDDPNVPNTGTGVGYYDRGATEYQDRMSVQLGAAPSTVAGHPLDATITGGVVNPWGQPASTIDFGDGSTPVTSPTFPLDHTYPGPGMYTITFSATDSTVGTKKATASVTIAPVGPLSSDFLLGRPNLMPMTVAAYMFAPSPWPITQESVDFGDGTVVNVGGHTDTYNHTYTTPGIYAVTHIVTDDHGRTSMATKQISAGSLFEPVATTRILDTRSGLGATTHPVGPGGVLKLQVTGRAGVPTDGKVTSVLLNLTATDATTSTHITAFAGGTVPTASNLNVTPGHDVGNAVLVPVAPDGTISLYNHMGNVDLVADIQGYNTTQPDNSGVGLSSLASPLRALDTRNGTGGVNGPVGPGQTIRVQVLGPNQLPSIAQLAVLNLTATDGTDSSYVTAAPNGNPPTNSSINFAPGQTVSNQVTVPINPDGTVTLYNHVGHVNLVVDLQGFYSAMTRGPIVTTTPTRVLDTRNGTGGSSQPLGANSMVKVKVAGTPGLPARAYEVVVNVTATNPTDNSWLNVFASGSPNPFTSNLNVTPGATVPNLAVVPVGPDGCIEVYNHTGSTDVIVDLQGYIG